MLQCALRGLNLEEALDDREHSNFRAAMAFILSYTPLRDAAVRWFVQPPPGTAAGGLAEIDFLRIQATVWLNAGRWAEAAESATRSAEIARTRRDEPLLLRSLLQLELALSELEDFAGMRAVCEEMERLAGRTENPRDWAFALTGQAQTWFRQGDLGQAEALLERARGALRYELGPVSEAVILGLSAACALQEGRRADAEALAERALDAGGRVPGTLAELRYGIACALDVLIGEDLPALDEARIRPALARLHRIARRFAFAEPNAWLLQGRHDAWHGRPARAASAFRQSLASAERLGSRFQIAQGHYWLGRLAQRPEGRRHVPEGAAVHLEAAATGLERLGCAWEAARARAALATPVS
jgi:tetratricopeptide (TPR) repeat protein